MKKTSEMSRLNNSRVNDLVVDVIEYIFIEWLVRRGIFAAFRANCDVAPPHCGSFRKHLRSIVRFSLRTSDLAPRCLISSAFIFALTPEGTAFWMEQSDAWQRFCAKLRTKF